jgi:putative membrane protein
VHPEVLIGVALLATAWAVAARRHGIRLASGRAAAFAAGLLAALVALTGPLHDLAETALFSAHMVQHLLLTLAVAPCLLAGTPPALLDALVVPALRLPGAGWALRSLTRPVPALALHAAALAFWHLPGPYQAALEADRWHMVEHATLTGTAILAWWPVLSASHHLPALHHGARILYLFVFGFPMTIVAALVTGADHVLYPFYERAPRVLGLTPLEDQRLGGVLMWVPAALVPLIAFTVIFFRWVAAEAEAFGPFVAFRLQPSSTATAPQPAGGEEDST